MEKERIEFWAWDTANERMVEQPYRFEPLQDYHKGDSVDPQYNAPYIYYESWQDVDDGIWRPCHILQYTGKRDKNGSKVFEGHICKWPSGNLSVIKWMEDRACFSLVHLSGGNEVRMGIVTNYIEIVGHVFTHPELLKQQNNGKE